LRRIDLAHRLDVSEETIRLWEKGAVQPSPDRLPRLIAVLSLEASGWQIEDKAPPEELPALARQLREERVALGLTQVAAAERLGVPQATYAGWETGRAMPAPHSHPSIAAFLGLSAEAVDALCAAPFVVDRADWPPFGQLVGGVRERLRLTRADLADRVGVSARTVMSWELGYRRPQPHQLTALAAALSVSVPELLDTLPRRAAISALGDLIVRRQRELGLRSSDLARLVGTTEPTVSRWINGHSRPEARNLQRLAEALGLPYTHLADLAARNGGLRV